MFFFFSFEPYIAIIGDIKNSRNIEERKQVQEQLNQVLESINVRYAEDISSKFMITLGDEFQGLLNAGENVISIIQEIQREMYPVQIRFGVGIGDITTEINKEIPLGADGPGYYKARSAIDYLKNNEQKKKTFISDIRIEIDEDKNMIAEMLNTILSLMAVIESNWTDSQRKIIWDFQKFCDSQKESAERLGIAQSSVQRGLINGNYYSYANAIETVNNVLEKIRR